MKAVLLVTVLAAACGSGASTAPPPPIAAVTIVPESVDIVTRGTAQLTTTMWDAAGGVVRGRAMTWASGNPAVATVSPTGLVTAQLKGSTTVTATCEGRSATAVIVVFLPMGV